MKPIVIIAGILSILFATTVQAQESAPGENQSGGSAEDLAKQLANPVASLISVPLQNNFDFGGGFKDDAFRYKLNVQPVVPFPEQRVEYYLTNHSPTNLSGRCCPPHCHPV